ncbi:hypothetical protein FA95DRAFT_1612255 [Auriscalpium vulgare]|uniref:Uncharacterized protein n=1 Tax=Auriscalpium vulgare TaxID=40419 RepID=A0ACB8R6S3_9AGAM|nr:hypothetical protein FA95DRAFT_1612255 [Auriscalpium vulgare]
MSEKVCEPNGCGMCKVRRSSAVKNSGSNKYLRPWTTIAPRTPYPESVTGSKCASKCTSRRDIQDACDDSPQSLSVEEIRNDYEEWHQRKIESARRQHGEDTEEEHRRQSLASLDVLGVSALEGTTVRAAVDWPFIRVQNSRRRDD